MKGLHLFITILWLSVSLINAQEIPIATNAEDRLAGFEKRKALSGQHILQNLKFHSIGPTIMGGRVTDVEVNPKDPAEFYIAYASGGLWLTKNNGQSYSSLFDGQMVMSIGDIAVNWNSGVIWVGTGENNSSRSSYSGIGLYMSSDTGKTWIHSGLVESHHIGRIVLHPSDPNVIYVATLGHLYSSNKDRGVYKSSDSGKNWKRVLFIDENTGAIDLLMDPNNSDVLFASMWHKTRRAWNFTESGETSGIYKSVDGGETWSHMSTEKSGFPQGEGLGRIGLAISHSDGHKIYAMLDNQGRRDEKKKKEDELKAGEFREMSIKEFQSLSDKDLSTFMKENGFPKDLTIDSLRKIIVSEKIMPSDLADYVQDANQLLFDTEVKGCEIYLSEDGGKTWSRTHKDYLDDFVFTYGYYFGQIRCAEYNDNKLYITGVPLLISEDGGATFKSINGANQHVDHHAVWVNPNKKGHLINGNDGGINISYDDGEHWLKVKSPAVGQFYTVNVDQAKPYNVYGGLQDNGVWTGPHYYKEGDSWEGRGRYPYKHLLGGDGFKVEIDNRNNKTIYTGYQFGHYFRFNKDGGRRTKVTPRHELGERPLRFNWQSPIHLSRHNQDILYFGSNKFHRSLNKGNTYDLVSEDLTDGGKKGDVAFGTITTIHESPLRFGLIYLGTDDGLVHKSSDVGYTWEKINNGLPENMWVTCVQASAHDISRVYLSLNAYRWDNFEALIYRSDDGGSTWKRIGTDLPLEPVNVIVEDPNNENLLYVGTDHGLYISLDMGEHFMFMQDGIPSVSVHDLVIQPQKNHLVIGTHGRSIYRADVTQVQQLTISIQKKGIHLFKIPSIKYNKYWGKKWNNWKDVKPPKVTVPIYVKEEGQYNLEVMTSNGVLIYSKSDSLDKGLNYSDYHLKIDENQVNDYLKFLNKSREQKVELKKADDDNYYLKPGKYSMKWTSHSGKLSAKSELTIKKTDKK